MEDQQGTFESPNGEAKIGQVLEQARKERGLTLDEVEHATKIRKRYLVGLEREDYRVLPDTVYARGFLKTYANYLGLDGEELSREFKDRRKPRRERGISYGAPKQSEFDRPLINPGGLDTPRRRRTVSRGTISTLLVAVLMLASVVGALYYVGRGVQISGDTPAPSHPSEERAADDSNPGGGGPPEEQGGTKKAQPKADESGGSKGAGGAGAAEPKPDTLTVEVSVEGSPSWLSILTDRTLAYEQIAQPGFSRTFKARREISIRTGNAGAVGVEVNGQDLGTLGESGEVLTRDFTLKSAS
jgi:cytoskeleton protein RodZ